MKQKYCEARLLKTLKKKKEFSFALREEPRSKPMKCTVRHPALTDASRKVTIKGLQSLETNYN